MFQLEIVAFVQFSETRAIQLGIIWSIFLDLIVWYNLTLEKFIGGVEHKEFCWSRIILKESNRYGMSSGILSFIEVGQND